MMTEPIIKVMVSLMAFSVFGSGPGPTTRNVNTNYLGWYSRLGQKYQWKNPTGVLGLCSGEGPLVTQDMSFTETNLPELSFAEA